MRTGIHKLQQMYAFLARFFSVNLVAWHGVAKIKPLRFLRSGSRFGLRMVFTPYCLHCETKCIQIQQNINEDHIAVYIITFCLQSHSLRRKFSGYFHWSTWATIGKKYSWKGVALSVITSKPGARGKRHCNGKTLDARRAYARRDAVQITWTKRFVADAGIHCSLLMSNYLCCPSVRLSDAKAFWKLSIKFKVFSKLLFKMYRVLRYDSSMTFS
jgi:hypothetical protein